MPKALGQVGGRQGSHVAQHSPPKGSAFKICEVKDCNAAVVALTCHYRCSISNLCGHDTQPTQSYGPNRSEKVTQLKAMIANGAPACPAAGQKRAMELPAPVAGAASSNASLLLRTPLKTAKRWLGDDARGQQDRRGPVLSPRALPESILTQAAGALNEAGHVPVQPRDQHKKKQTQGSKPTVKGAEFTFVPESLRVTHAAGKRARSYLTGTPKGHSEDPNPKPQLIVEITEGMSLFHADLIQEIRKAVAGGLTKGQALELRAMLIS